MLAAPAGQGGEFGRRGLPLRRVARPVALDQLAHQVRPLQDDAAARRRGRRLAEVLQECRLRHRLEQARAIIDGFGRELNDRARLDVAVGADVVAGAGRHRTERLPLVVPVGVDDGDRELRPHLHDEPPDAEYFLRVEGQLH